MSAPLSDSQNQGLVILERVTSVFSLSGLAFIFATFIFSKRFRRPVNRLIFYASWGNALLNIATIMSVAPTLQTQPKTAPQCRFQGFIVQMFLPADALWNLSMAVNVYLTVFRHWDASRLRNLEPIYITLNYGIPFIVALTYLFINDPQHGRMYGPATLWCWIDEQWEHFRIWTCYLPAWVAIVAIFAIYASAWAKIWQRRRHAASVQVESATHAGQRIGHSSKTSEIRVTTEFSRHSFVSPMNSPGMSPSNYWRPRNSPLAQILDPFRLNPECQQGFDLYSVTIERSVDKAMAKGCDSPDASKTAAWTYTRTALLYFVSLLITWLPSSMNRVYSLVYLDEVSWPFSIVAGLVLPLMGFWNAVIYVVTSWDDVQALCSDLAFTLRSRTTITGSVARQGGSHRFVKSRREWFEMKNGEAVMQGDDNCPAEEYDRRGGSRKSSTPDSCAPTENPGASTEDLWRVYKQPEKVEAG